MKKLQYRVGRKKEILRNYVKKLKDVKGIKFFEQNLEFTTPWFIDALVEQREEIMLFLKGNAIGTRLMYPPINKQVAYQVPGEHPVSNKVGTQGLWLPSSSQLTDDQINYICDKIAEFYKN